MSDLIFITHPEVIVDANQPVPNWSLSETGQARMQQFSRSGIVANVTGIVSSTETKALEAAALLAKQHPNAVCWQDKDLGENDRSATGFLPPPEFEATADAFFADPDHSVRGWETASAAQTRIISAIGKAISAHTSKGDLAVVSHGAVGTLLLCHLMQVPIARTHDQPGQGHFWRATLPEMTLHHGWHSIT